MGVSSSGMWVSVVVVGYVCVCQKLESSVRESPFHGRRGKREITIINHHHSNLHSLSLTLSVSVSVSHSLSSIIINKPVSVSVSHSLSLSLIISSSHSIPITHHRGRCHRIISIIHHHFLSFSIFSINLCHWLEYSKNAIKNRIA